jgi:ribosomal-protein-alanine N-acetyltransferase
VTSGRPPSTARLCFGEWRRDDVERARSLWGDVRVTGLIGGPWDDAAIRARLAEEVELLRRFGVQYWPIELRARDAATSDVFVGCSGLRPRDEDRRVYEIGVHLRPAFWRRGLASEGFAAVVRDAFDRVGASALIAGHHPDNEASRRLILAHGFRHTHDEPYAPTGRRHPSYLLERD